MLLHYVIPYLKFHINLCERRYSSPFTWDSKTSSLKQISSKKYFRYLRLHEALMVIYSVSMIYTSILNFNKWRFAKQITTFAFILGMITLEVLQLNFEICQIELMQFVNGMLQYETKRFRGNLCKSN